MKETTNQQIGLRPCQLSDIQAVMEINESTLPENYPMFFYEQILERYPESFLLAYVKDQPTVNVGYIMWRVERGPSSFGLDYVKKGHLVSLAVLPNFRRMGVASLLLKKSMQLIEKFNISEYVLEVRVSNSGAVRLYEEMHKFERIRIIGHYYRDGEDAFYMSHKFDLFKQYVPGSMGMTDRDLFEYYFKKNQGYLCFQCPKCGHILLKGLGYSYPGSMHPNDPSILSCAFCAHEMTKYAISQGEYDLSWNETITK